MSDVVRLSGVSVRFGRVTALDGASFHVPHGSITGLVGRNGAGKSTAIHLLAGLLQPLDGRCEVLGAEYDTDASRIRQCTGFLLAEPALFAYLTPAETLRFLAEAYRVPAAEITDRVMSLLRYFELEEAGSRTVAGFSTGMQKRLALAAALIHAPVLLVLDEPFESLDPLLVRRLKRLLSDYRRAGGTVLLSSHLLGAVEEICDRIIIMEAGRIVVEDSTAEARARVVGGAGTATLEDLYAYVMEPRAESALEWLTGSLRDTGTTDIQNVAPGHGDRCPGKGQR